MFFDHRIREQGLSAPEKKPLMRNDVIPGLSAVISIWHPSPQLGVSSGRYRLTNPDVKEPIVSCVYELLVQSQQTDPEIIEAITRRCVASKTLREKRTAP
jgi:DNA gyrase/topoisomerase IV subunit B